MYRYVLVRCVPARQASCGKVWVAWCGEVRYGSVWQAGLGLDGSGKALAGYGLAWQEWMAGTVRHCVVRYGAVR